MTGGVLIEKGLEDWQILQQNENGMGRAHISGTYVLTSDELLDHVTVSARILLEDTGEVILPAERRPERKLPLGGRF